MKWDFKSILFIFVFTLGSFVFAAGPVASVVVGGDARTDFEKQSCVWMIKQYFLNQNKEIAEFKSSGGELDCRSEAVIAREREKFTAKPGSLVRMKDEAQLSLMRRSLVSSCWDKQDQFRKREAELMEQLIAALRIRINLYDAKNLLPTEEGKKLLNNQCKIIPQSAYAPKAAYPLTFTGLRQSKRQSDADFIRDHSISCDVVNRVGVDTTMFQAAIRKQFPSYQTGTTVPDSLGGYDVAQKIKSLYPNANDFEDRQICQQMVNKQTDKDEANRILPPPKKKGDEEVKKEKPDECKQFENTFDCSRYENKEIKVMMGWPLCARELMYSCQAKLDSEGKSGGKPAQAHGEGAER